MILSFWVNPCLSTAFNKSLIVVLSCKKLCPYKDKKQDNNCYRSTKSSQINPIWLQNQSKCWELSICHHCVYVGHWGQYITHNFASVLVCFCWKYTIIYNNLCLYSNTLMFLLKSTQCLNIDSYKLWKCLVCI